MSLRRPWGIVAVCGLAAATLAQAGVLVAGWLRDVDRARETSAFNRGKRVAESLGCFSCHGADGKGGTVNLGPGFDEIPSFAPSTFARYCQSPGELEEWILDGMPARLRKNPEELERARALLIAMPSFRGRVEGAALADLLAYVRVVAGAASPPRGTPAFRGLGLAEKFGCFGCHGPEGRAMAANPGSFRGYIPAWDSEDFLELVRSPGEFSGWVLDGAPERLRHNPLSSAFLEAQEIKMPAYRAYLDEDDVSALWEYVRWVRQHRPGEPAP